MCKFCWRVRQSKYTKRVVKRLGGIVNYRRAKNEARKKKERNWSKQRKDEERKKRYGAQLFRLRGVSFNQYQELLAAQGNKCALCFTYHPDGRGVFHMDHDHASGKPRGILCSSCNLALGKWKDSPEILRRAANYVEFYRADHAQENRVKDGGKKF